MSRRSGLAAQSLQASGTCAQLTCVFLHVSVHAHPGMLSCVCVYIEVQLAADIVCVPGLGVSAGRGRGAVTEARSCGCGRQQEFPSGSCAASDASGQECQHYRLD